VWWVYHFFPSSLVARNSSIEMNKWKILYLNSNSYIYNMIFLSIKLYIFTDIRFIISFIVSKRNEVLYLDINTPILHFIFKKTSKKEKRSYIWISLILLHTYLALYFLSISLQIPTATYNISKMLMVFRLF
jgi:hypothetical protein